MAVHHYIPRFLLKGFSNNGTHLTVKNKHSKETHPKKIAKFGLSNFNDISVTEFPFEIQFPGKEKRLVDLETFISEIYENPAAPIIDRIVTTKDFSWLSDADRYTLIKFVSLQWHRTPGYFHKRHANHARMTNSTYVSDASMYPIGRVGDKNLLRDMQLGFLPESIEGVANVLMRAELHLHIADDGAEFIIGDDPVTVFNETLEIPSNLTVEYPISAPGGEVYLPLSPQVGIHLFTDIDAKAGELGANAPHGLILDKRHVDRLNNLQEQNAVRYLISRSGQFPK